MKVLVVSDSHGDYTALKRIAKREKDAEIIVHAGDYRRDIFEIERNGRTIYAVLGNCDGYRGYYEGSEVEEFAIGKSRILLTHGHLFGVKNTLTSLAERALQKNISIAIYGHTHVPNIENVLGVLCINPGSCSSSQSSGDPTYAVLEMDNDGELLNAKILHL